MLKVWTDIVLSAYLLVSSRPPSRGPHQGQLPQGTYSINSFFHIAIIPGSQLDFIITHIDYSETYTVARQDSRTCPEQRSSTFSHGCLNSKVFSYMKEEKKQ